jgi:hypothetical protein
VEQEVPEPQTEAAAAAGQELLVVVREGLEL